MEDLLIEIEKSIQKRNGARLEMEITPDMNKKARRMLIEMLEIEENEIYELAGPLDLSAFMKFSRRPELDEYRETTWGSGSRAGLYGWDDIFEVIREKGQTAVASLESFKTVVDFVRALPRRIRCPSDQADAVPGIR